MSSVFSNEICRKKCVINFRGKREKEKKKTELMEEIDSVETEKFCSQVETIPEDEEDQRRYKTF